MHHSSLANSQTGWQAGRQTVVEDRGAPRRTQPACARVNMFGSLATVAGNQLCQLAVAVRARRACVRGVLGRARLSCCRGSCQWRGSRLRPPPISPTSIGNASSAFRVERETAMRSPRISRVAIAHCQVCTCAHLTPLSLTFSRKEISLKFPHPVFKGKFSRGKFSRK